MVGTFGTFGWDTFGAGTFARIDAAPKALPDFGLVREYKVSPETPQAAARRAKTKVGSGGKKQQAAPPLVLLGLPAYNQAHFDGPNSKMPLALKGGRNFTLGAVMIPRAFHDREFAEGICCLFRLSGPQVASGSQDTYQIGFHRPSELPDLAKNWTLLDAPEGGPTNGGVLAAQRAGEYIYSITGKAYQAGQQRIQMVERMNSVFVRERRHHDESRYYEGPGTAAAGAAEHSFEEAVNADLFVSDHYPPELYYLSNFGAARTTDRETVPLAFHYVQQDQRDFGNAVVQGPFYPRHIFKYEYWATWQDLDTGPSNTQMPALVWPWTTPNPLIPDLPRDLYAPPEVWFFVPEMAQGKPTQRLKIYRSEFLPDVWNYDRGFARYAPRWQDWDVGGTRFNSTPSRDAVGKPRLELLTNDDYQDRNPEKVGFVANWLRPENLVGSIGPFVGLDLAVRNSQLVFRVVRDPRQFGVLHLVAQMATDPISGAISEPAWHATSVDDGKTWGRVKRTAPLPQGNVQGGAFEQTGTLMATRNGELLGVGTARMGSKELQTLVQFNDMGGQGLANERGRQPVIFRTGAGGR